MISPSLFECFWPAVATKNEEKGAVLYFVMSCDSL
jgi:hypothetical protein